MTATIALPPRTYETPKFYSTLRIDEFPFETWRDSSPYDQPSRSQHVVQRTQGSMQR
jgi:hypothetical protein